MSNKFALEARLLKLTIIKVQLTMQMFLSYIVARTRYYHRPFSFIHFPISVSLPI